HLEANPIRLLGSRIEQGDVGNMDRHLLLDDATRLTLHRIRPHVLFNAVHAFDEHSLIIDATQHGTTTALVLTGQDHHLITFADLVHRETSQSTSGASETIFMNFSVRSSRVTGPKIRVPIGSSLLLSRTA